MRTIRTGSRRPLEDHNSNRDSNGTEVSAALYRGGANGHCRTCARDRGIVSPTKARAQAYIIQRRRGRAATRFDVKELEWNLILSMGPAGLEPATVGL